ncbi:hypothetical protein V6N13_138284 [Hibiscus sabdariffa]|uniref:Uncharacterized protein n=1 Tax=Hibiscus sabdariffa TaxID=183260 RepID=A0ABR2QDG8_9ROSI
MDFAISRWPGLWDPWAKLLRAAFEAERLSWGRPCRLQGAQSSWKGVSSKPPLCGKVLHGMDGFRYVDVTGKLYRDNTMSSSPNCDIVGHWGESHDDLSEDKENIVPVTEDDDIHLLDADDVEVVMTDASEGNGLDVEDDVWSAVVARLGLGNGKPIWGYVGSETEQPVPSYLAYEPPTSMYNVYYTAMRDQEHEAQVFGSSSSSNYGELIKMLRTTRFDLWAKVGPF